MTNSWLARNLKKIRTFQIPLTFGVERSESDQVVVGASFARFRSRDVLEIAQVLRVEQSESGVAHVRFVVTTRDRNGEYADGPRTLGLEAFKRHFHMETRNATESVRWGPPAPRPKISEGDQSPSLRWPVRGDAKAVSGKVQKPASGR